MKKVLFAALIVAGTTVFQSCENKKVENDETVISSDTTVEMSTDTTIEQTVVETDTTTRTVDGGETRNDTIK